MELTIGEKLMVLRIRAGLTAKSLGKAAFPNLDHPNVKVARLESGQIKAKASDIKAIVEQLGVDYEITVKKEVVLNGKLLDAVPELKPYVSLINQAAAVKDKTLIRSTLVSFAQNLLKK